MAQKFSGKLRTEAAVKQFHGAIRATDRDKNIGTETLNDTAEVYESVLVAAKKKRDEKSYSKKAREDGSYSRNASGNGKTAEKDSKSYEGSNPRSRELQKKQYRESLRTKGKGGGKAAAGAEKKALSENGSEAAEGFFSFVKKHAKIIIVIVVVVAVIIFICSHLSAVVSTMNLGNGIIAGSSYTADSSDINGADSDYTYLENDLKKKIDKTEELYPGYDEYRYDIADINHNPYVLISYLTVKYEDFKRADVQGDLRKLFNSQYTLTYTPKKEVRTRTVTKTRTVTDPETGETSEESYQDEEEYDYWIMNVKLTNNTLESAVASQGLNEEQRQRFELLNQTLGNRPDLFGADIYAHPTASTDILKYDIPPEALSDQKFKRMITEAEKYLGYPYVWGGSSPSTSFDCSGFVCWVINHSGNGWNVGRTTAEGLRQGTKIIPASEAKPGDLIFFQGTYDTAGASHVGIYVGDGKMIHCGNPIQYASINTPYWKRHFYCFGRMN